MKLYLTKNILTNGNAFFRILSVCSVLCITRPFYVIHTTKHSSFKKKKMPQKSGVTEYSYSLVQEDLVDSVERNTA